MATYEQSGVNIDLGDECSKIAYEAAKGTFSGRRGMIGEPVLDEGGFAGVLDMGDYYLVQNDDGVGTKMLIAGQMGKFDTIGYDLLAMVADDAVCVGAEPLSVTNTLDVDKADTGKVAALMSGLQKAALEHHVVVPGGEIAEVGEMAKGYIWNATCIGIVEKSKLITGADIEPGDKIIGLRSAGLRSNGFSLVRHILLEKFGPDWPSRKFDGASHDATWGEITLTPSKIYTSAIMAMHGRYGEKPKVNLKGVVHITGGGIPGNLPRVLKNSRQGTGTGKTLGARLDNLPEPHPEMLRLMELGPVARDEANRTWNMGVGMILISNDVEEILRICNQHNIEAQAIGEVVEGGKVEF